MKVSLEALETSGDGPNMKTTLDYLRPLHALAPLTLPATVGTHQVTVGAREAFQNTQRIHHTATVQAALTLEESSPPSAVAKIPALAKLPVFKAFLQPPQDLRSVVKLPNTEEFVEVDLVCPETTFHLVPQAAVLQMVWTRYKVNLFSLKAALAAIRFQQLAPLWWSQKLAKQAFGHPEGLQLGDSAEPPDRPNLVPSWWDANGKFVKLPTPFAGPAAEYYFFADVYHLVALLELVKAGDIKLDLPSNDCLIDYPEPNEDKAFVQFLDTWEAPSGLASSLLPLEARNVSGKVADQISEFFRYRSEIWNLREKRQALLNSSFHLWLGEEGVDVYVREKIPEKKEAIAAVHALYMAEAATQEKALPLYAELTHWAAKHKERLLKATRERARVAIKVQASAEAVKDLVAMPSNMGKLPAHFAAIPAGLESGLHMETDQYGRAILRVRRQSLELAGGPPPQEQIPFTLPLGEKGVEQGLLMAQAELLLGVNGPRWLIPQGVVAISKLYSDLGGYSRSDSNIRIYENDWVDTMRPGQVERFRQKGRGAAFGHTLKPKDAFNSLLGVLSRLTYDSGVKVSDGLKANWSELNGFYLILANGEDSRGRWTEVMLNPALHKFIAGDGGLPYMVTNTKAMFEYRKESLDYTPAAQMGLEQLARSNIYNRNTVTLSDPQGGGLTRLAYANRWGILRGPNEKNTDVLRRFNRTLDNLSEAGVIAEVKVDGRDKTGGDAFGVKLLITMHEDYRKAYDLGRDKEALRNLEKQLATPFAEPRKLKSSYTAPTAKKRGRPPKNSK